MLKAMGITSVVSIDHMHIEDHKAGILLAINATTTNGTRRRKVPSSGHRLLHKMVKAKPLISTTGKHMERFVSSNIPADYVPADLNYRCDYCN
ncbi:hypothetical protein Tco_1331147 [Tanacetum coccineum]